MKGMITNFQHQRANPWIKPRLSPPPRNLSAHQRRSSRYCKICCKTKIEMGWPSHTCSETSRQPLDPRVTKWQPQNGKKITPQTDSKMARRHCTVERNHLGTRCQTARMMAGQSQFGRLACILQHWTNKASYSVLS
ncbi:hypothetical protein ElyMa_005656600 [Elysia marginata]|uniref:Uncharacterized protein n=1 Tax=Elysia marginata TaxID=1093978 RepID=A0AAV4FCB6_9GAST|nr:hypothetical protein ElyMa_005656600 [Elysia marginata]